MKLPVAERFKSLQGEGLWTGTPMAFIRLVGCSVGKTTCTHCDTDFDRPYPERGGGLYDPHELVVWAHPYHTICITGGEPLDRQLKPLVDEAHEAGMRVHVETSGTVLYTGARHGSVNWLTVSPKPGYKEEMIEWAAELKVIVGGLGNGPGWPSVELASRWAREYDKPVYLQPRNHYDTVDLDALAEATKFVQQHPELRLSAQLHKFLQVR